MGGDSTDTVLFAGTRSSHHIGLTAAGEVTIVATNGDTDTIRQIEKGEFSDGAIDLGFRQAAPSILKQIGLTYRALLGRAADLGGIGFWAGNHQDAPGMANYFLNSNEFPTHFGTLDNTTFVSLVERNALHHAVDPVSVQQWVSYLDTHSRAEMGGRWWARQRCRPPNMVCRAWRWCRPSPENRYRFRRLG